LGKGAEAENTQLFGILPNLVGVDQLFLLRSEIGFERLFGMSLLAFMP
jgi:hypothetical protein